jgi:hypothetical protein
VTKKSHQGSAAQIDVCRKRRIEIIDYRISRQVIPNPAQFNPCLIEHSASLESDKFTK